jgi:putative colanic acid biosynthesis glycosyltransferase
MFYDSTGIIEARLQSPLFSIVTVVRNDLTGLRSTLASIDSQTCRDFECVVVDGASTDGAPAFLAGLTRPNLHWSSEPDEGIYDAMNKGAARASGRFLIFMNAADIFASADVLARVAAAIQGNEGYAVLYGDAFQQTPSGETFLKPGRDVKAISYGMFTHHQAMFFHRSLFPECGYDKTWKIAGDYALVATAYQKGHKFLRLGFPICTFSEGGVSTQRQALGRQEALLVQKKILHVSGLQRGANEVLQWAASQARTHFRPLYNLVRYQSMPKNSR